MYRSYLLLGLSLLLSACVSTSKYEEKVAEVGALKETVASLEDKLKASEAAGKTVDMELKQYKDGIANLLDQHEQMKAEALTVATGTSSEKSALAAKKQTFAGDMAALEGRLSGCEARVKELSTAVALQKVAATSDQEIGNGNRTQRIKALTDTVRTQESQIAQLKVEIADLSRKRATSNEAESAAAAVRADLRSEIEKGEAVVTERRDKMIVTVNEQVLFESGSAELSKSGKKVLDRMTKILKKVRNNQIRVEGHTDSALIGRKLIGKYPTNWDLAAARSTAVVKYLQQKGKIDPKLLAMAGYGPYQPVTGNQTEKGRKMNRRIEIALVPMEAERPAAPKAKQSTI